MRVRKLEQPRGWAITFAASILKPTLLAAPPAPGSTARRSPPPAAASSRSTTSPTSTRCCRRTSSTTTDGSRATSRSRASSRNKALGGFLTSAGQIPVERLSRNAVGAYDAAVRAIGEGECIVIYPEGTLTRDPDLWPMKGKTGAARIALATGCPVIPVGQWGAHEVLPPYTKTPHLVPRKNIVMKAGRPRAARRPRRPAAEPASPPPRPPTGSWPPSPRSSPTCAARPPRPAVRPARHRRTTDREPPRRALRGAPAPRKKRSR